MSSFEEIFPESFEIKLAVASRRYTEFVSVQSERKFSIWDCSKREKGARRERERGEEKGERGTIAER